MPNEFNSINNSQLNKGKSTQKFLPIGEIHDDCVVLKNGGIRAVLRTSSINFNLKSDDEQRAILYSYQGFLNTLDFPIQIVVRSKKLDVDAYLEQLKNKASNQSNKLLQTQTYDYIDYIKKLVEYADIMEKDFLVVIPMNPYRTETANPIAKMFQKITGSDKVSDINKRKQEFQELKKKLNQRINTVKSGLENIGLKVNPLKTKELIELYYSIYNPITSRQQKNVDLEETTIEKETSKLK